MQNAYKLLAVLGVIATAAVMGKLYGIGATLSCLAAGVLLGVILILWSSLQNLTGDAPLTFEEALSLGSLTPEEEKKRAVLRTLKDLDYERAVGKISEEDFQLLSVQYRAEARQLLRSLDEELAPARAEADALLKQRLSERALETVSAPPASTTRTANEPSAPDDAVPAVTAENVPAEETPGKPA